MEWHKTSLQNRGRHRPERAEACVIFRAGSRWKFVTSGGVTSADFVTSLRDVVSLFLTV